ncbi:unnamed protein product [Eruca vesicaria subsp. sativa]|uniref:Uncharacterized protein n=1 Tax=Eruca vesicaria subsp. sativa TaxID=29727 RepID=A0ABC8K0C1_ERUVS|nr:unnamed protein product [Eruca vesicaria subsp. sativa]
MDYNIKHSRSALKGGRRLEEVTLTKRLRELQKHTSFCIDIDMEILLVTFDEAVRNENNAVSMAISGMHGNFIDTSLASPSTIAL